MLRREEELRRCEETQQHMLAGGEGSYVPIVEALQAQVSREFGLAPELGTMLLRCAESFAQSDEERAEIVALSLYRRHNRCLDGSLQVGDQAPVLQHPLHLLDAALTPVHLFDHLRSFVGHSATAATSAAVGGNWCATMRISASSSGVGNVFRAARSLPLILFAGSWS